MGGCVAGSSSFPSCAAFALQQPIVRSLNTENNSSLVLGRVHDPNEDLQE